MDNKYFNILGTDTEVSYWFNGVPKGGESGSVLTKLSDKDYDMGWEDPTAGETSPPLIISYDEKIVGRYLDDRNIYQNTVQLQNFPLNTFFNVLNLNNLDFILAYFGSSTQTTDKKNIALPTTGFYFGNTDDTVLVHSSINTMKNALTTITFFYVKKEVI